jgi:hypothetical protein
MRSHGWAVVLVLGVVGFASAGDTPHEAALQQMLGSLDEITKILKKIEGEEQANAAKPDLRKAGDGWIEARAKAAKLQPPERAEKERLTKIYKPKLEDSMKRFFTEVRRVENIPGGKEAMKEISGVLKKDGK